MQGSARVVFRNASRTWRSLRQASTYPAPPGQVPDAGMYASQSGTSIAAPHGFWCRPPSCGRCGPDLVAGEIAAALRAGADRVLALMPDMALAF